MEVCAENLQQYVDGVADQVIGKGVAMQIDAFKAGFDEVLFSWRPTPVLAGSRLELRHARRGRSTDGPDAVYLMAMCRRSLYLYRFISNAPN